MSDMLQSAPHESAGADDLIRDQRRARWTRTHTIWLLIVLSLSPGVVAALFRAHWATLPAGVRMSTYIMSGILISAACTLIFNGRGDGTHAPSSDPASRNTDS